MAAPKLRSCPVCGKDIPVKAKACHHCGADEKTGWNEEESSYDGLDLPDENFDYEKFQEEEFGRPRKKKGRDLFWKITAAVMLLVMLSLAVLNKLFN